MAQPLPVRSSAPTGERLFIVFALVFIAVVLAGTGYTLHRTRQEVLEKHLDATVQQTRGAEGYLTQSIDLAELAIQDLLAAAATTAGTQTLNTVLDRAARTLPFVRSFSLADSGGRIWASSNLSNLDRVVVLDDFLPTAREDGEFLRFGVPWKGRDFADGHPATAAGLADAEALTFMPIARAAVVGGKPVIALVALNPDYFLNQFTQDEEAPGLTLDVLRVDGRLLLSTDPAAIPGSVPNGHRFSVGHGNKGVTRSRQEDGHRGPGLTAHRQSRRYPIVVAAHLTQQQALAEWAQDTRTVVTLAIASTVSILILCGAIVRRLRRIAREDAEASAKLDLAAKVFQSADEAIMVSDPHKRIVSVNPAFERVTGFSAEEVIGHTAHVIFPDPDMAPIYDRVVGELDQRGSWQGEVVTRHKDGHPIYEWLTVSTVKDAHGQIIHYVGFLKDVTKLKSVEEQVRKLSLAVEQSPSSILITDLDGRIEYVNRCFTEVTGYSAAEAIGQNPRILKSGNTPPETYAAMWAALSAGQSWQGEFINRHKDGGELIEHATVSPVRQPDGRITHYLAVKHDVTDSKRMERALRDNESRLRLALEGLGDGVWDWDVRSGHVYFSHQWLEMLGYREEDLAQNVQTWARLIHPDDRAINRALLEAHLRDETPAYSHEYRLRTKEGEWKWILVRGAVIARTSDGAPTRMLGTHVDISQRKVLEESLLAATHAAEAANLAKSEFLANMSHEIRTPMNAILGLTDLVMDSELSAEQRHYLELAHRSAEDLLTIINEILDFSKIEAGVLQMEEAEFDLRQCVETAIAPLAKRAEQKGLRLSLDVHPEAPHTVQGDPLRLRQVLINLVSNAIKFTDRGEVSVGVAPLPDAAKPGQLLFSVADTGIGIPSDKLALVFDAFFQADTSTTRRFGGTGLGLPISRRIVERMGGRLWVESREGAGSTFHFSVPLPALAATSGTAQSAPAGDLAPHQPGALEILLAEDNVVNQKLAVAMLERQGHVPTVAGDGAAALELARQRRFDAILMDVQMPRMNGIDATRAIRAHEALHGGHTPIIAMTANAFAEDRQRCIEAGMDDYLSKPVGREALANALARFSGRLAGMEAGTDASAPALAPPPAPSQFQREATLASLAGDAQLLKELANVFVATCGDQLEALRVAVRRGDWPLAAQAAHGLKGGAVVFGAAECVETARQVEALARTNDPATADAATRLAAFVHQLMGELQSEVE